MPEIIDFLAFIKENSGISKNFSSLQQFKDEYGEQVLNDTINSYRKVNFFVYHFLIFSYKKKKYESEKKKREKMFNQTVKPSEETPKKSYDYGYNSSMRKDPIFTKRSKKDRKLYTRRIYTYTTKLKWMKMFSEMRTENLSMGFSVPTEQGNFEWSKRDKFTNLHKHVGGLRKWLISNRRGSSVSIKFPQSPLPLIGIYYVKFFFEYILILNRIFLILLGDAKP